MVIACNTAHLLLPALEAECGQKFTSLIEATLCAVKQSGCRAVGLLASPTTIRTKLYQSLLEREGIRVIVPNKAEEKTVETSIRSVIAGNDPTSSKPGLCNIVRHMKLQGAQSVILGCTELSVVFTDANDRSVIDPLTLVTSKLLGENNDQ